MTHSFCIIKKNYNQTLNYLDTFENYMMRQGDTVVVKNQSVTVSKADLNLFNGVRADLEKNRGGVWVSSVIDEMRQIKHHSLIDIQNDVMYIKQEQDQL